MPKHELTPYARDLRNHSTKEEITLWTRFLKQLPFSVRRQKIIGPYIVDFYIPSKKIAIELDGSQHFEPAGQAADAKRDAFLSGKGIRVLRYPNNEVNGHFQEVCEDILNKLDLK